MRLCVVPLSSLLLLYRAAEAAKSLLTSALPLEVDNEKRVLVPPCSNTNQTCMEYFLRIVKFSHITV